MNHGHGSGSWNSETAYYTIHITSESSTHNQSTTTSLVRALFYHLWKPSKLPPASPARPHCTHAQQRSSRNQTMNQISYEIRGARARGLRALRGCGCAAVAGNTGYSNADSWRVTLACGATRLCCAPDFASLQVFTYATKTPRHKPCSLQVEAVRDRETGRDREGRLAFIS